MVKINLVNTAKVGTNLEIEMETENVQKFMEH